MRVFGLAALLLVLGVACDDTVFHQEVKTYDPTWFGVQVFMLDNCVSCHDGTISSVVFPDEIEADLQSHHGTYVVPYDPDGSLLWRMISGELQGDDPGVMPIGTGPLPDAEIEHVQEWILNGAPL